MTTCLPNILLTGGSGQLARTLVAHPKAKFFNIFCCPRAKLDITDPITTKQALQTYQPHFIINTAAFTAVDQAEINKDQALQSNYHGTKILSQLCHEMHIPLLHLSTDYVFSGKKISPYHEEDETNPINYYGLTKQLGEQAIREYCEQYIILRISAVFSEFEHNFLHTICMLASQQKNIRVVHDQHTCPTAAIDIATAIYAIIEQYLQGQKKHGTYHFCSQEIISWYDFAVLILKERQHKNNVTLQAITTAQYPILAKRPAYSVLDCKKLQRDFSINQPSIYAAIKKILPLIEHPV